MTDGLFELAVITKERLHTAIKLARKRIIYCAPGVDPEIATDLAEATKSLPAGSVYMHVDPSERALRTGYGTMEGITILAQLRKAHIAESWRIGLLITDEEAFIYAPAPEAKEPPPREEDEPNGLILRGRVMEHFVDSIQGYSKRLLLEPKEAPNTSTADEKIPSNQPQSKQQVQAPRIPEPKTARMMDMVRRLFKQVRFNHSLTLADKKVRLTAKDFGFRTEGIDPQLSISFNIVSDEHRKAIKKILNGVNREVEKHIKSGLIKSLPPDGYFVWYAKPDEFEAAFAKVKATIEEQINGWFANNYQKVQDESKSLVQKFLDEDLFDRVNPPRAPRHHGLSETAFRNQWVQEQSQRFDLPSADEVKKTLRIDYQFFDISEQMIADQNFRNVLEDAFRIKLDEILEREERPSSDYHG